ncbi:MAG: riboflavin synthase [Planctomycetes bacterium]|nr:riboflavin synthase [Planctomycetota bacterium]
MFGGIVAGLGRIVSVKPTAGAALRLDVDVSVLRRRLVPGASVSVSGVCLTVVRAAPAGRVSRRASFDVVGETVRRSTLGGLAPADVVNLEGALRGGDEVGGHQVSGHVDGVGEVVAVDRRADETWMTIRAPRDVHDTLVPKGWVAVDGCSLTVAELGPASRTHGTFSVALIPTTLAITTLGRAEPGAHVNLEGDPLGKHVAKWMAARAVLSATRAYLVGDDFASAESEAPRSGPAALRSESASERQSGVAPAPAARKSRRRPPVRSR